MLWFELQERRELHVIGSWLCLLFSLPSNGLFPSAGSSNLVGHQLRSAVACPVLLIQLLRVSSYVRMCVTVGNVRDLPLLWSQ